MTVGVMPREKFPCRGLLHRFGCGCAPAERALRAGKKVTGVGVVLTVTVTTAVTFGMRVYVRAFGIGLVVCLAMYSADPCIHDTGGCWLDRPCPMTYS